MNERHSMLHYRIRRGQSAVMASMLKITWRCLCVKLCLCVCCQIDPKPCTPRGMQPEKSRNKEGWVRRIWFLCRRLSLICWCWTDMQAVSRPHPLLCRSYSCLGHGKSLSSVISAEIHRQWSCFFSFSSDINMKNKVLIRMKWYSHPQFKTWDFSKMWKRTFVEPLKHRHCAYNRAGLIDYFKLKAFIITLRWVSLQESLKQRHQLVKHTDNAVRFQPLLEDTHAMLGCLQQWAPS